MQQEPSQFDSPGGVIEGAVKRELGGRDRLGIRGGDRGGQRLGDALEIVDLGIGDVLGRRGGKFLGDGRLQPEDVVDVLPGQRQHDVAAVRLELHHAFAAQLQQCLAHRRDADAEFGRGLVEPDERPRPQRAGHDRSPQVARHLVGQLRSVQR